VAKREGKKERPERPGAPGVLEPASGEEEKERAETGGRSGNFGRLMLLGGRRKSTGGEEAKKSPEAGRGRGGRARRGVRGRGRGQEQWRDAGRRGSGLRWKHTLPWGHSGAPPFPHSSSEGARDSTAREATARGSEREGLRDSPRGEAGSGTGGAAVAGHEIEEEDFSFSADSSARGTTQRLPASPAPPDGGGHPLPSPQENRRDTVGLSGASPAHPAHLGDAQEAVGELAAPWGRSRTGGGTGGTAGRTRGTPGSCPGTQRWRVGGRASQPSAL